MHTHSASDSSLLVLFFLSVIVGEIRKDGSGRFPWGDRIGSHVDGPFFSLWIILDYDP